VLFAFSPANGFSSIPIASAAPRKAAALFPLSIPAASAPTTPSSLGSTAHRARQEETSGINSRKKLAIRDTQHAILKESEHVRLNKRSAQHQVREKNVQKRALSSLNTHAAGSLLKKSAFSSSWSTPFAFTRISTLDAPASDSDSELIRFRVGPKRRETLVDNASTSGSWIYLTAWICRSRKISRSRRAHAACDIYGQHEDARDSRDPKLWIYYEYKQHLISYPRYQ
jgi:hypothetical protein